MATHPAMKITRPHIPELLPEVVTAIETILLRNHRSLTKVLELGSGWSTLWFASRTDLTSVEHDLGWMMSVLEALKEIDYHQLRSYHLIPNPKDIVDMVRKSHNWDLIYIDCVDEARVGCFEASLAKVVPGGHIVLDDSHWEMFRPPNLTMPNGWKKTVFRGEHTRKTGEVKYHETTILQKPL